MLFSGLRMIKLNGFINKSIILFKKGGINMKLVFPENRKSDCTILKETKKYITFRCNSNTMKYRYNKETKEIQDGTYRKVIKGLIIEQ